MFVKPRHPRSLNAFARTLALAVAASATLAWADPVKITFLPPPMEGTISLGVYDATGKLVRTLRREADLDAFTKGDDGLETTWDGNDDQGKPCPAGTYRAKGVTTGDLGIEGVDFIGNDWVTGDDSPHIGRIVAMEPAEKGGLFIQTFLPGNPLPSFFTVYPATVLPGKQEADVHLVPFYETPPVFKQLKPPPPVPGFEKAEAWTSGTFGSIWVLREKIIQQFSRKGERIRTLDFPPGDPPPVNLAFSISNGILYVLYENTQLQRLRAYDFTGIKRGAAPKVLFENDITFSERYEQIASELKFPGDKPFTPTPTLTVTTAANPLTGGKPAPLILRAIVDKEGSWLATHDGLPLCKISDTPQLRWVALGRSAPNAPVTVFDSDGAAVEQFQISAIGNLMTFDAGTLQWTPPAAPAPSITPTPPPPR